MISAALRLLFWGLLLAGVSSGRLYADLTTGGTLSLEWLVDSSDAVYLVRLTEPTAPDGNFLIERERMLKVPADAEAVKQCQTIDQWQIPRESLSVTDGDQWLVFIRTWEAKRPTIVRHVNLTRPLERSATAALNSEGMPLPDRKSILRAAEERVRLNRQLSERARQVREYVDEGGGGSSPFGDPAPLEENLGGFRVRIHCDHWDNPPWGQHGYRIRDEDLLLTDAIVPADPKYHKQLLEAAGRQNDPLFENRASIALVNYPGEETERVLKDVASRSAGWTSAKYVLWYFKFRHNVSDPLNDDLVGRWRLIGQRELIDMTLDDDNTFTATGFERPQQKGEEPRRLWHGKGYWVVRDSQLTLWRREFLHPKLGWMSNQRTIFADKCIKEASPDAIVLAGGPLMVVRKNDLSN